MTKLRHFQGAWPFFIAVFLNAFVDLGHKIIVQNTVYKLYEGAELVNLTAIVNGLILLPFIILMSPAGWLSDRFLKTEVMRATAWGAVACTVLITCFYYLGWFWPAFIMTFLLATQSAFYSPAKYGYIKELFGSERLGEANGIIAAISIVSILAGTFVYTIFFEGLYPKGATSEADILRAIAPIGFILIANAAFEVFLVYRLPSKAQAAHNKDFDIKRFATGALIKEDTAPLRHQRTIRLAVIGLATFWGVGQVMLASFPAFLKEQLAVENTIIVQGILACTGIGIALGSIFAGRLSKNHIETGLLPLGALGITIGLWLLPHLSNNILFAANFLMLGFAGGMFIVPLNTLIQYNAKHHELGKTLAANNWVQNIVMLSFLVLTIIFAKMGFSTKSLLFFIATVALIGCCYTLYQLPQSFTRIILSFLVSRHYNINVLGMKKMPARGGVLLLGNHVSWIDWAIVQLASPRPVRFVMIANIYNKWYLKWFFDLFGCIPIQSGAQSRRSLDKVAECLNNGEVVCLFPEGTISRTGHLAQFRRGYEKACEKANDDVVIIPFYIRGLWGSQFSRSSERFKENSRSMLSREIIVAFGDSLNKKTSADILKRRVLDLSISSWQAYINDLPSIGEAFVKSAKKVGHKALLFDSLGDRKISGQQLLTGTLLFARRIKTFSPENAIGVLLPTSAGGVITNLATILLGKTIVNLNYTSSVDALKSAVEQAEIKTIYTSHRFVKQLEKKGIDLHEVLSMVEVIDVQEMSEDISLLERLGTLLFVKLTPTLILKKLVCRQQSVDDRAVILFSSGSEGSPKGIELTHRNILANVKQISDILNTEDDDAVMANLPLFHAFGLTVTQFMPLLEGIPMICHADPTDVFGASKAISKYRATIMASTSTFLRLYCRNKKIHPLMLNSLRLVIAGAEKLNPEIRDTFGLKFNLDILEGYGATEITPVASVNLPDKMDPRRWQVQLGQKEGSVGMPLPGTSAIIVDPDTLDELETGEAGMILIGGPQVMKGYLKAKEKTESVITELNGARWYITGDKGYLDEDGFLFIVDRYSRFAKIGGEMISLSEVENAIRSHLPGGEDDVVVVPLADEKKGEKLVVLLDQKLDSDELKLKLQSDGLNTLAIPNIWLTVDELPKLGSGKTDFATAKEWALSATEEL